MTEAIISASIMIAVISLLRLLLLKRLPKSFFRLLWIIAALRLIIPFSFNLEVETDALYTEKFHTVIIDASDAISGYPSEEAVHFVYLAAFIKIIFAIGTIISGGFLLSVYIRMRKTALHAKNIDGKYADRTNGMDVRIGKGVKSPFSCGILHPIIYIPSHILLLDDSRLDMIIAHERRHIRCGDQLVKWLLAAAVCLNWYNPLVWLMWRLASRDIELACDEALVHGGTDTADYALCLIAAEEMRCASVCSFGAPLLNERIEFIMKSKKLTIGSFIASGVILSMMTVFFINVTATESDGGSNIERQYENQLEAIYGVIEDENKDILLLPDDGENDAEFIEIELVEYENGIELACPLTEHGAITSHFGEHLNPVGTKFFNVGVNIAAEQGTLVYAAATGTVTAADYDYTDGNYIIIDHGDGYTTVYRHLGAFQVSIGEGVEMGTVIGTVGKTGSVTGANLGFSIIKDGAYISPERLFN